MQKKLTAILFSSSILLLVALLYTACQPQEPIKIGVSVELTGPTSDLGIAFRNGAQLAVEEINTNGGINSKEVALIIKDDQGSPEAARQVDQELIDEGVVAILGHITSQQTSSVLELINQNDVLMISGISTSTVFTGLDDNLLRLTVDTRKYALATVQHILENYSERALLIVYNGSNPAYVYPFIDFFSEAFETSGGEILDEVDICCGDILIDELQNRVIEKNPPLVLAITTDIDLVFLVQYAEQMDFHPQWFGTVWAGTDEVINKGGLTADGIELAMSFDPESQNQEYLDFKEAYQSRFGSQPSLLAVSGYTAIYYLADGLKQTDGDYYGLKQALLDLNQIDSIQGTIYIDEYGDANRDIFITKIENGIYQVIDTIVIE